MAMDATNATLYDTDLSTGLSEEEAAIRAKNGLGNTSKTKIGRSYGKIIFDNIFTVFNLVLYGIAALFIIFTIILKNRGEDELVVQYFAISRYFFLFQPTLNIIIGTVQQIRSKQTLEKLKIAVESHVFVLRDGKEREIPTSQIVVGDIVILQAGQNVPTDMRVIEGRIEVDESLLTGESDTIMKNCTEESNMLYSGSTIMSGKAKALTLKVGDETYANAITKKVKGIKKKRSALMSSLYHVIYAMSIILFAIVVIVVSTMLYKIWRWGGDEYVFNPTIEFGSLSSICQITATASAFAIGVIPTGLVLLTSMALALSVIKMASEKTLIQELYALEGLSRVDTICLDKTGTLTDGSMTLKETIVLDAEADIPLLMRSLLKASQGQNATSIALSAKFVSDGDTIPYKQTIAFSSEKKQSGIVLENGKQLLLGAPEFLTDDEKIIEICKEKAVLGYRTLLLTLDGKPLAVFILKDIIRKSAKHTIEFFNENGVAVKIISGDALDTVRSIAAICGVKNCDKAISLQGMSEEEVSAIVEEYTIFARVSPEQKEIIVRALQAKKHKAAMTGDGVNDILALRKADSSITFEKATDSAKNCADVILLDNDFSHLKSLVSEGRRVVNNVERTSILFLMKTMCIFLLSIALIPFAKGHMYFTLENMYLCQDAVLAVAGFLLSLESSKEPIQGSYEEKVFPKAIAGGFFMLFGALLPCLLDLFGAVTKENVSTLISLLTVIAGLAVLCRLSMPFTKYRIIVLIVTFMVIALLSLAFPHIYLGGMPMGIEHFVSGEAQSQFFQPWNSPIFINLFSDWRNAVIIGVFVFVGAPIYVISSKLLESFFSHFVHRMPKNTFGPEDQF